MVGKAAYFRFHKYLGLIGAAFLLVQSLTGLVMVFGSSTAQLIDPSGMTSGSGQGDARPARLLATAEAVYPDYRVDRLVYPDRADGTYLVWMADSAGRMRYVSLDRHTGVLLRSGSRWHFPLVAALHIHDQWLSGTPGTVLISLVGVMLVLIALMGIAFWWPRRQKVKKSLTVQWHLKPRAVLRQLHRTTGVTVSALLIFMAGTGLFVSVPMIIDGTVKPWSTTESFAPKIEPAIELAEQKFPGKSIRDIRIQAPNRLAVFFWAPERNSMAVHRVVIETGRGIVSVRNAFQDHEPWVIALPLHDGLALGVIGQTLIFLIGLALSGLAITGPVMWYQARQARRRPARSATPRPSQTRTKAEVGSPL